MLVELIVIVARAALLSGSVPGVSNNAERKTYNEVFSNYDPVVRPRNFPKDTVDVTIYFTIKQIIGFNEVDQVFQSQGLITAEWTDEFLQWDETLYGGPSQPVQYLAVPATMVWRPDFGLQNSAQDFYKENYWRDYRVLVTSNGTVAWNYGGVFSTTCSMDIRYYPFDMQTCNISLTSWVYYSREVMLTCGTHEVITSGYEEDGQWELKSTSCFDNRMIDTGENSQSKISFSLRYARRSWWFILNIILPTVFMICLVMMMFWLPPESGEKIGMGVTILLAFSVFQLLIASEIPKTSATTPMLSAVMIFVMSMTTISIVNTIVVLRLHHHSSNCRAPKFIRYFLFRVLARAMRTEYLVPDNAMSYEKSNSIVQPLQDEQMETNKALNGVSNQSASDLNQDQTLPVALREMTDVLQNVREINQRMMDAQQCETIMDEWKALAGIWERFMFWLVFIVVIIMVPYFFIGAELKSYHG